MEEFTVGVKYLTIFISSFSVAYLCADALYRSDFFPGLGWMLTKTTWDELSPKWPKAYPYFSFGLHLVLSLYIICIAMLFPEGKNVLVDKCSLTGMIG